MSLRSLVGNVAFLRWLGAAAVTTVVTVLLNVSTVTELSLFKFSWSKDAPAYVSAYVTAADGSLLFARDPAPLQFAPSTSVKLVPVISVDDHERFQTIDGFGAALTGSSAYLLATRPDHGAAVLADLFRSDTGIGLSYVRITIGASDFSLGSYTYDDAALGMADPDLAGFSIGRDAQLLSILQAIHSTSSDVKFIASPWSAPAWMKSSQKLFGGGLRPQSYPVYARYIIKYVRALQARGIGLDAITPQNEPLLNAATYPSMTLSSAEEAAFVKTALGPALQSAAPTTKLLINDHNWDGTYPLAIFSDKDASRYVAGSAFHCYAGQVQEMAHVRAVYPSKGIYLDECSGGAWSTSFRDNLRWDMRNLIIGGTANWARTVLLGNLALDDAAGPTNGGCATCRGVITLHADGSVTRNVEYYVLAHAARFVRPGAVRIASFTAKPALPNVAFLNADGNKVLIVLNDSDASTSFAVRSGANSFRYSLRSGSVATFLWH